MNSYFLFTESPCIYLPGHACLSPTLLTHSLSLILRGRSSPSRHCLTGINDCEPARCEERTDKKDWVFPQRRLTSTHPVLSARCGATAPLPFDRQPRGSRLTASPELQESIHSLAHRP
jgi:hypothetical protein